MKLHHFLFFSIAIFFLSCTSNTYNKHPSEGVVNGQVYYSREIGWTIEVPKGWGMISNDSLNKISQKGIAHDKEADKTDSNSGEEGGKYLVSFKKEKNNCFVSISQPTEDDSIKYQESLNNMHKLLYGSYTNQGVTIDTTSSSAIVDGLSFYVFNLTLHKQDNKIIGQQIMFSRLINGDDFGAIITYTNDSLKKVMLDAFMNSKFDHTKK